MNYKRILVLLVMMAILLLGTSQVTGLQDGMKSPQGTYSSAFTYQGRLQKDGVPVVDTCDLQFSLWDALSDGGQVGSTLTRTDVEIREGLFTVADLDFGAGAFDGDARWLEVAVQCGGDTSFTVLNRRQALTATPYASYAAQVGAHSHLGETWTGSDNPLTLTGSFSGTVGAPLVLHNSSGDGMVVSSAGSYGVHVSSAGLDGVVVGSAGWDGVVVGSAGDDGVMVYSAGSPSTTRPSDAKNGVEVAGAEGHGLFVGRADQDGVNVYLSGWDGVRVESAGADGVVVGSVGYDGVHVASAGDDGVRVDSAGDDGVYVYSAGSPSTTASTLLHNGFEVAGAEGDGLWVGQADDDGVYVYSAGSPSTTVSTPEHNGFEVAGAEGDGLHVGRADVAGLHVASGYYGVVVGSTDQDGVVVVSAGGDGLHVSWADDAGLHVESAGDDGLNVFSAGADGVYVGSAGVHGVNVESAGYDGVHVNSAGWTGVYADTAQANHEWGFYTPDKIYAGSALAAGGPSMIVAQNGDGAPLEPGMVVVVSGVGAPFAGSDFPAPLVRRAGAGHGAVVGVVYARFVAEEEVEEVERDGQASSRGSARGMEQRTNLRSRSAEGPIAPGEYLLVVVLGPAQVKAGALAGGIRPGDLLVVGGDGQAAAMQADSAYVPGAIVGTAMEALEAAQGTGLIWVLVQPR